MRGEPIILKALAFALLTGSLAILAIQVPEPDLLAVLGVSLGLAAYDLWR